MTIRPLGDRAGAIVIHERKILLLNRIHNDRQFYCIPGGHIEGAETPEECAVRELQEETGLTVHVGKLFIELVNQGRKEYYFLVDDWSGTIALGGEELERNSPTDQFIFEWVLYENLENLVFYPVEAHKKLIKYFQKALE